MGNAKSAPPHRKAAISSSDCVLISITIKASILNTHTAREQMKGKQDKFQRRIL